MEYGDVSRGPYKLVVRYEANKQPPWKPDRNVWTPRPTYQIPNVDLTKIDWDGIKQACGGKDGYRWGHWRAYGKFDQGRMYVFGDSQASAETRLMALARLSKSKLERVTYSNLRVMDNGVDRKIRDGVQVYPAYFSIINHDYDKSRVGIRDNPPPPKVVRVPLYTEKEPEGAKDEVRAVLNSKFEYET